MAIDILRVRLFGALLVVALSAGHLTPCQAQALPSNWKNCVVLLIPFNGNNEGRAKGTGFLYWDYATNGRSLILVTCRHVLEGKDSVVIKFNPILTDTGLTIKPVQMRLPLTSETSHKRLWVTHPDTGYDVAVMRIPSPRQLLGVEVGNITMSKSCANDYGSLHEGDDIVYLGFPAGFEGSSVNTPVLRKGMISLIDSISGHEGELIVEAQALPGNSGSPVFRTWVFTYDPKNKMAPPIVSFHPSLVGMMRAYWSVGEPYFDREDREVVRLPQHSGLSFMYTFDVIERTIAQLDRTP